MLTIPWQQVRVKLLLLILACGILLLGLTNFCFFRVALKSQRDQLRRTLMAIATTGALIVDAEAHGRILPRPESMPLPEYRALITQLRAIQHANPDIRYVYTMVPSDTPGEWLFIGDSDEQRAAPPGYRYNAARFPAMLSAMQGPSADEAPVTDEWGTTLSGYTPIRDRQGRAVAILGVDMSAALVRKTQELIETWFIAALIGGLVAALLLSELVSAWIARPIKQLVDGTRRVSAGDLFYEIKIKTHDEFAVLATALNHMTYTLRLKIYQLRRSALSTVQSLVIAIEAKDHYTRGHSERVRYYAVQIATRLALATEQVEMVERMSLLHDIGKIGIKESVLDKPARLTSEEYAHVKEHPELGARILAPLLYTPEEMAIVRSHHERYDGTGYPAGLRGEQIPLVVAAVSVADAFDAMTSPRPYRTEPLSITYAAQEMKAHAGTQFHPDAVRALLDILYEQGKLEGIYLP